MTRGDNIVLPGMTAIGAPGMRKSVDVNIRHSRDELGVSMTDGNRSLRLVPGTHGDVKIFRHSAAGDRVRSHGHLSRRDVNGNLCEDDEKSSDSFHVAQSVQSPARMASQKV